MKPIILLSNAREKCVTFFCKENPDIYAGYRFIEHEPEISSTPLSGFELLPSCSRNESSSTEDKPALKMNEMVWNKGWSAAYVEDDPQDPTQLSFRTFIDGSARVKARDRGGMQEREIIFQPADDGVRLEIKLSTHEPVPGAYIVQQCLRFTGNTNEEWRKEIAHLPILSELDMQAMGNPNESLTYAVKDGRWIHFPVQYSEFFTPPGKQLAAEHQSAVVDHGLIVREGPDRRRAPIEYWKSQAPGLEWKQVVSGLYWERTVKISNRHPADCIHANVDFGPLREEESRTLCGRFYFLEGTKDDLLEVWRKDFSIK